MITAMLALAAANRTLSLSLSLFCRCQFQIAGVQPVVEACGFGQIKQSVVERDVERILQQDDEII